jgi:hypothetical protein
MEIKKKMIRTKNWSGSEVLGSRIENVFIFF